jgi:hypothetical protein
MTERKNKRQEPEVRLAEDLAAEVDELLEFAKKRGLVARQGDTGKRVMTTHPDKPNVDEFLRGELRQALEGDVVSATQADDTTGLLDWELQREISKKALLGLRRPALLDLAMRLRLDKRGRTEDVAERIARHYGFDGAAIAQVILDTEQEPEPQHALSDRLFPLERPVQDLESIFPRLKVVLRRFIRVGVARWVLFEQLERRGGALKLTGRLRAFRAYVAGDQEIPQLGATPVDTPFAIEIGADDPFLRIRRGNSTVGRAACRALEAVTELRTLGRLPIGHGGVEGLLAAIDPNTRAMLDLLHDRLRETIARSPNLTVARFRMSEDDLGDEDRPDRPRLKAVRFEGTHLLDSIPACRLIALDGRALVDLSLVVVANPDSSDEPAELPIRLSFDRDHANVVTDLGNRPDLAIRLHRELLLQVEQALQEGVKDVASLERFVERINEFARSGRPVDRAVMLRDEESQESGA